VGHGLRGHLAEEHPARGGLSPWTNR
jgi:hypothetical protein